jgi:hypothetical protein
MVCSRDISNCLICKWVWICPLIYDVTLVASSTYTGYQCINSKNWRYQFTFFSSVSSHLPVSEVWNYHLGWYQWYSTISRSLQPTWRHKLADIFTSFTYQTNSNISWINHKNKKLKNKLHYSLKSSFIQENKKFHVICTLKYRQRTKCSM